MNDQNDLIRRGAAISLLRFYLDETCIVSEFEAIPAVTPQERVGRWMDLAGDYMTAGMNAQLEYISSPIGKKLLTMFCER